MLSGADRFELIEYIRPLEIPVIFITERSVVDVRVRGLRMGADDYIVKIYNFLRQWETTADNIGIIKKKEVW